MKISAIILAAGLSQRMGKPKMVLPWGDMTVIEHVVSVIIKSGIDEVVVVVGGEQDQFKKVLTEKSVHLVHNPLYKEDNMVLSLQVGLSSLKGETEAVLVILGDQPQIQTSVVKAITKRYEIVRTPLIVPSYQMRRGHPWLISKQLWGELMDLQPPRTLRDFLNIHSKEINYVQVKTDSILRDLDTPTDYANELEFLSKDSKI